MKLRSGRVLQAAPAPAPWIHFLIDTSQSTRNLPTYESLMASMEELEELDSRARLSFITFNTHCTTVLNGVQPSGSSAWRKTLRAGLQHGGMTNIRDSIIRVLAEMQENEKNHPSYLHSMVILTDGYHNVLTDTTPKDVEVAIKKSGFQVRYLWAHREFDRAFSQAAQFGIGGGSALALEPNGHGMQRALSAAVRTASEGGAFSQLERTESVLPPLPPPPYASVPPAPSLVRSVAVPDLSALDVRPHWASPSSDVLSIPNLENEVDRYGNPFLSQIKR